jgi:hypothetical protein
MLRISKFMWKRLLFSTTNIKREGVYWDCSGRILKCLNGVLHLSYHSYMWSVCVHKILTCLSYSELELLPVSVLILVVICKANTTSTQYVSQTTVSLRHITGAIMGSPHSYCHNTLKMVSKCTWCWLYKLPYFPVDNAYWCITRTPNFLYIPFDVYIMRT